MAVKILNSVSWDSTLYRDTIRYLLNRVEPDYSPAKLRRFIERSNHLTVKNNKLYYDGKPVVKTKDVDTVLTELYIDPVTSVNSRDRFYEAVLDNYVGISRRRVQLFLTLQESYQLHLPVRKRRIVKPILTSRVLQRIQCDTIDMSKKNLPFWNDNYKYCLTAVDLFSKYAWVYPLKRYTSSQVATAISHIFNTVGIPSILQTDNGVEFLDAVQILLRKYSVKHVRSLPYKSQSQGAIEAFNKTFKRRIYHWLSIYNTKTWIDIVPKVLEGYNNTKHSTTGYTPYQVFYSDDPDLISDVQERISVKGKNRITVSPLPPLKKGMKLEFHFALSPKLEGKLNLGKVTFSSGRRIYSL